MTGFALGPPAEDSPEFIAFLVEHGIVPRSEDELDFLLLLCWFNCSGVTWDRSK